jgi:ubiquinone/menaquinone biosynthesis C-methylase UbiE
MPYEQRKRRLLVQAVDPRSRVVLEVGCADGHNLLALAEALPKAVIVGTDVSNRAVRIAADRTRHMPGVRVVDASDGYALEGVVQSRIDCVLLAEILYYLGGRRAMTEALAPLRRLLSADARVVMLHGSSDAEELHARAASALGLIVTDRSLVADPERPFVIAVASRRE